MCRNIDNASQLKFWPNVMFSPLLENYINQLADVHCVHPDSLAIVLINCAAATMEFSYVLRANSINHKGPSIKDVRAKGGGGDLSIPDKSGQGGGGVRRSWTSRRFF